MEVNFSRNKKRQSGREKKKPKTVFLSQKIRAAPKISVGGLLTTPGKKTRVFSLVFGKKNTFFKFEWVSDP